MRITEFPTAITFQLQLLTRAVICFVFLLCGLKPWLPERVTHLYKSFFPSSSVFHVTFRRSPSSAHNVKGPHFFIWRFKNAFRFAQEFLLVGRPCWRWIHNHDSLTNEAWRGHVRHPGEAWITTGSVDPQPVCVPRSFGWGEVIFRLAPTGRRVVRKSKKLAKQKQFLIYLLRN